MNAHLIERQFARIGARSWNDTPTYANLTFGTASVDTVAYNMLDAASGNYPGGISTTQAGFTLESLVHFLRASVLGVAFRKGFRALGHRVPHLRSGLRHPGREPGSQ